MVASVWGNQGVVPLSLPTYSVDYNYHMGEVDRHDQMRSYAPTQLISVQNWLPLFFSYSMQLLSMRLLFQEIFLAVLKYRISIGREHFE